MNYPLERVAALCLSGMLAACEPFWSTPETQARDFVETLVTAPADSSRLRDIAKLPAGRHPEELIEGLAARVGLDFLRAQQAQGVTLKFFQGETRQPAASQRFIDVHVSYLQPGTTRKGEVRFEVKAEKDPQGNWRLTGVTGEN